MATDPLSTIPEGFQLDASSPEIPEGFVLDAPTPGRVPIEDVVYDPAETIVAAADKSGLSVEKTAQIHRQVNKTFLERWGESLYRSGSGMAGGQMSLLPAAEQRKMVEDVATAVAESPRDLYIGGLRFTEGIVNAMQWFQDVQESLVGPQEENRPGNEFFNSFLGVDTPGPRPEAVADWLAARAQVAESVQQEVTLQSAPITKMARMVLQQGVPSLGVAVGLSVLTGNPAAGYVAFFASSSGQAYKEQKQAGAGLGKASLIATLTGAAEVGGEMLVFPKFVKGATKGIPFREAVALITENATQEGATGFTQEFLRQMGLLTSQGKSIEDALPLAFEAGYEAIPENAFVGGLTAGAANVAMGAAGRIQMGMADSGLKPVAGEPLPVATPEDVQPAEEVTPTVAENATVEPPVSDAAKLLAKQLARARRAAPEVRREQRAARKQRVALAAPNVDELIAAGVPAAEALDRSTAALKGPLTTYEQRYASIREELGPETVEALHRQIAQDPKLKYFEKLVLGGQREGLLTKLIDGDALTIHQARLLGDYFGKEVGNAAAARVPYGDRFWNTFLEYLNLPRTALASLDMSGIMRQGRALMEAHPEQAGEFIANYGKAFASEEFARQLEESYKQDALYEEAKDAGLELPEWGRVDVNITELSEEFAAARLLQKIPGVRASERSFVTALNALRFAVFSQMLQQTEQQRGRPMTDQEKNRLASRINNLSGRTSLPAGLKQISPLLNAFFFSPRFFLSRLAPLRDIPMSALHSVAEIVPEGPNGRPTVKRWRLEMQPELPLAMKGLAKMMATNITIMGLLQFLWGDDDELQMQMDPRSADFAKLRYQNMHIDPDAGYAQTARFLMRMATGTTLTAAGEVREIDRSAELRRFLRSKQSPLASLLLDWAKGENFLGKPFAEPAKDSALEGVPGGGIAQEVYDRLAPLVAQDALDALQVEGVPEAILGGGLTFVGVGLTTYEPSGFTVAKEQKNELAEKQYGTKWDNLKPSQQKMLRRKNPQLEEAERAAKRESYPQQEIDLTEDVKVAKRIYGTLTENVQQALNEAQVKTGVTRVVLGDFWLNKTRFDKYQELAGVQIQRRVERRIATGSWANLSANVQADILQREVEQARAIARNEVVRMIERGDL